MVTERIERDALGNADNSTKLLLVVELGQLKTIQSAASVRQHRLLEYINANANDWEFVDAARIEADKSYKVGIWAERIMNSLHPDRIEDEWSSNDRGMLLRKEDQNTLHDPFYPVADEW